MNREQAKEALANLDRGAAIARQEILDELSDIDKVMLADPSRFECATDELHRALKEVIRNLECGVYK